MTDAEHGGDDVAAAYDRWADTYDSMPNATRDLDAAVLRRQGLPNDGRDVVELGAGTGKNTVWLAERARSVVAIDMSAGMLERARHRVPAGHVRFLEHDIRRPWPLPPASADLVIANLVLEHVERLDPVVAEAKRVLRPHGLLFLCELHPFRQLRGAQARFASADTGEEVRVPAWVHDVSEYVNAGLAAGFAVRHLGEWRDTPDAPRTDAPRLLSLLLARDDAP